MNSEKNWRFIDLGIEDPYRCMATHEAILVARTKGHVPNTFLLERYDSLSIFLGYHQIAREDIDTKFCQQNGIKIVRRISGGGAGYMDPKQLNYATIVGLDYPLIPFDVEESYKVICEGIIKGLEKLGIQATFRPINDILVNNRKISGSCQYRDKSVILQHGSVLIEFDIDTMLKVIKIPGEKLSDKKIHDIRNLLTWVTNELRPVELTEVKNALKSGFEDALSMKLSEGVLTTEEKELIDSLYEKYSAEEWVYKPDMLESANKRYIKKARKGIIRVSAIVRKERILDILITGDYSMYPEAASSALEDTLRGTALDKENIREKIHTFFEKNDVRLIGASEEDFVDAVLNAVT